MRQFLLGKKVAYASGTTLDTVADGAIGVFYNNNGELKATNTGAEITEECMLVLGRPSANGGPVVLPLYKNHFSYVKGVYAAATQFKASIVISAPTKAGSYSIIIAKKGVLFNERNKWTATVYVKDTTTTAAKLAENLAAQINNNSVGSGVSASVSTATITITANSYGVDYEILAADELYGTSVSVSAKGMPAYGDASYIKDLAMKAAADAGFEYTYRDAGVDLYPAFPLDPLAGANITDTGYTIFTLRFAEPRQVKTRDEIVHQIVQVAFPTGAEAISTFETVCKTLSGEVAATSSVSE